jgi:D-serine deaminase-like pyridoxal phosphate-dependent protein
MTLHDLETPAPIVDLDRMERNLDRAAAYAAQHGLALRPHIKTHKSPRIAAEQIRRGAAGVTCATPREAEVMTDVADDVLLAYPPVGAGRARRIVSLAERARISVALDTPTAIEHLAAAARPGGRAVSVHVEMDLGMRRVGVQSAEEAVTLARIVRRTPPLEFAGIMFYPGHVRERVAEQDAKLEQIDRALRDAVAALARAGVRPAVVSGGSTPTIWRSHELNEVTEIRPGTYVFNDRTTAEIGACTWDDCALTVLATVDSTAEPAPAGIDARPKAHGRVPMRGSDAEGFGALLDRPEVTVKAMSEEHGILDLSRSDWRPQVGERVQVVACRAHRWSRSHWWAAST